VQPHRRGELPVRRWLGALRRQWHRPPDVPAARLPQRRQAGQSAVIFAPTVPLRGPAARARPFSSPRPGPRSSFTPHEGTVRTMKRYWLGLAVLAGSIGIVGCGAGYSKVEGKVEYDDGGPVEGAMVQFVPTDAKDGKQASGVTDSQGNFTLKTGNTDGALKGKYKVVITKTPQKDIGGAKDPKNKGGNHINKPGTGKGAPSRGAAPRQPKTTQKL